MTVLALDHVQLAIPRGGEETARGFYGGVLGFTEVPKPEPMRARGGLWFQAGPVGVHLGVQDDPHPPEKAHPAFVVRGLDAYLARLRAAGCEWRASDEIAGVRRGHTRDPFGNRIELIEAAG
jgi:catechol 2,3-dioxygenase-like lactoylglutathione lyase family enzyme